MASSLDFIREFTSRAGEMLGDLEVFDYVTGERTLLNPGLNPSTPNMAAPDTQPTSTETQGINADTDSLILENGQAETVIAREATSETGVNGADLVAGASPTLDMTPDGLETDVIQSAVDTILNAADAQTPDIEAARSEEFSANATTQEELMRREIASENSISGESDRKRRELEQQRARRMADGLSAIDMQIDALKWEIADLENQIANHDAAIAWLRRQQELEAEQAEVDEEIAAEEENIDVSQQEIAVEEGTAQDAAADAGLMRIAREQAQTGLQNAETARSNYLDGLETYFERNDLAYDSETNTLMRYENGEFVAIPEDELTPYQASIVTALDRYTADIDAKRADIANIEQGIETQTGIIDASRERIAGLEASISQSEERLRLLHDRGAEIIQALQDHEADMSPEVREIIEGLRAENPDATTEELIEAVTNSRAELETLLAEKRLELEGVETEVETSNTLLNSLYDGLRQVGASLINSATNMDAVRTSMESNIERLNAVQEASDALNESIARNFQEMQIGSVSYSSAVRSEYEIRQQIAQEITGASPEELEMSAFIYVDLDDPMGRMRMGNTYLTPNQQGRLQEAMDVTAQAREQWVESMDAFEDDQETLEALQNERELLQARIDELGLQQDELMAEMMADPDNAYMASLNRAQNERMIAEAEAQIEAIDQSLQISADFVAFLDDGNNLERIDNIVRQYTDPNSVSQIVSTRDFFENTVPENLQNYLREEMPQFFGEDALSLADYMEANPSMMREFGELQSEVMTLAGMAQSGEAEPGHINQAVEAFLAENPQIPQEHRDFIQSAMINDQLPEATTLRPTAPEPAPEPVFVAGGMSTPAGATTFGSHSAADGSGIQTGIQTSADFRAAALGETSQPLQSTPAPGFGLNNDDPPRPNASLPGLTS